MPNVQNQPDRQTAYLMQTSPLESDSANYPLDPAFDTVWRQTYVRPFDSDQNKTYSIVDDYTAPESFPDPSATPGRPPWLRQFPPGDGFGRVLVDAACWDKWSGFWYVVHRQGTTTRLLRTTDLLDTDCTVIRDNFISTDVERVKDIHVVTVQNSGAGFRKVLAMRIGRNIFPSNAADWGDRLAFLEIDGAGSLRQFGQIPYPRNPVGSDNERQNLWSMCVGGIGATDEGIGRVESEVLYGLIDSRYYTDGDVSAFSQQITRWQWNRTQQTFTGGARGSTYQGATFAQGSPTTFDTASYIKRISWNKFTNNGDGNVMFPVVRLAHPTGRGNGSYQQTESRVVSVLGTDNTFLVHLYKCPLGPLTVVDDELDIVRQYDHPTQAWLGDDDDFIYVHIEAAGSSANSGIYVYAPNRYPGNQNDSEPLQTAYRLKLSGRPIFGAPAEPDAYPPRLILGPGCY